MVYTAILIVFSKTTCLVYLMLSGLDVEWSTGQRWLVGWGVGEVSSVDTSTLYLQVRNVNGNRSPLTIKPLYLFDYKSASKTARPI